MKCMQKIAKVPVIIAIAAFSSPLIHAEEPVSVLREQIKELSADLDEPINKLNDYYKAELEALSKQAQADGKLTLTLAVTEELRTIREGSRVGKSLSPHSELARLQTIYDNQMTVLHKRRTDEMIKLLRGYIARLERATVEYTKLGELEKASSYQNEMKATEERIANLSTTTTPNRKTGETGGTNQFVPGVYLCTAGVNRYEINFMSNGTYKTSRNEMGIWRMDVNKNPVFDKIVVFKFNPVTKRWNGTVPGTGQSYSLQFLRR